MRELNNAMDITTALNSLSAVGDTRDLDRSVLAPFLNAFEAESLIILKEHGGQEEPMLSPLATVNQKPDAIATYVERYSQTDPVFEYWRDHRYRGKHPFDVFRFSDIDSVSVEAARQFGRFLDSAHVRHMLIFGLEIDNTSGESLIFAIHRSEDSTDFGETERQIAAHAAPIMRQIFRGLRYDNLTKTIYDLADHTLASFEHRTAVILSPGGRLLGETSMAAKSGLAERICSNPEWVGRCKEFLNSQSESVRWQGIELRRLSHDSSCVLAMEPNEGSHNILDLTPRQAEIAKLVARGCRNWQIAELLGVSENTIVNHLSNIYDRVGIGSRTELAVKWNGRML